ncbi:MAG: UbiA family prenyltransferase [Proteobacteria bacterium]|nr:UbiA family prenyltransferase [Pseudomonadota bacterium]
MHTRSAALTLGAVILRDLWTLARPRMLWWLGLLLLVGYGYGHWEIAVDLAWENDFLPLVPAWALLHLGTMWLNAYRDQDEGEVMFGEAADVPAHLDKLALGMLAAAGAMAALLTPVPAACLLGCVVLAFLYSHPRTAWKGHPIGGPLVNVVGYGLLTPLAAFAVVRAPLTPRVAVTFTALGLAMAGLTFAAQAFQGDEDAARGDRTLVVTHGPAVTLQTARACIGAAAGIGVVAALLGFYPRLCLIAVPMLLWVDAHFRSWIRRAPGTSADAKTLIWRMCGAALLLVIAAVATYLHQWLNQLPLSGLGTARGAPW